MHGTLSDMIDFLITELLDDATCVAWLEQHLHPAGLTCPRCHSTDRRLFRHHAFFPTYRCRTCQCPSTIVLLLRGIAKGESTARPSRELALERKRLGELRSQIQTNLYDTLPGEVMTGTPFEADELYQNAGGKKVRPIATWPTHRVGAPISRRAKALTTTTGHQS